MTIIRFWKHYQQFPVLLGDGLTVADEVCVQHDATWFDCTGQPVWWDRQRKCMTPISLPKIEKKVKVNEFAGDRDRTVIALTNPDRANLPPVRTNQTVICTTTGTIWNDCKLFPIVDDEEYIPTGKYSFSGHTVEEFGGIWIMKVPFLDLDPIEPDKKTGTKGRVKLADGKSRTMNIVTADDGSKLGYTEKTKSIPLNDEGDRFTIHTMVTATVEKCDDVLWQEVEKKNDSDDLLVALMLALLSEEA